MSSRLLTVTARGVTPVTPVSIYPLWRARIRNNAEVGVTGVTVVYLSQEIGLFVIGFFVRESETDPYLPPFGLFINGHPSLRLSGSVLYEPIS